MISLSSVGQTKDWQEPYNKSFDYFYNEEYTKATDYLKEALRLDPNQPAIYWRLSCILWSQINGVKNIPKDEKARLEQEFDEVFNAGIALCDSNSTNPEVLFCLGALYSSRVIFKQAVGRRNMSMLKDIKESREYLEKIKKTEDFYYEARGYLGIFNYGPIVMSGIEKTIAGKFFKWDLDEGYQQIKDAIKYSKYSEDIKILYRGTLQVAIERRNHKDQIPEAIELSESLLEKYPRNLSLKVDLVTLYHKKGESIKAYDMGKRFQREIGEHPEYSKFYYIRYLYIKLAGVLSGIGRTLK